MLASDQATRLRPIALQLYEPSTCTGPPRMPAVSFEPDCTHPKQGLFASTSDPPPDVSRTFSECQVLRAQGWSNGVPNIVSVSVPHAKHILIPQSS